MELQVRNTDHHRKLYFLLLMVSGIGIFAFHVIDRYMPGIGYFVADRYWAAPCLMFLGAALSRKLTLPGKISVTLGMIPVAWFLVVQLQHQISSGGSVGFGAFAVVYLLAFPYAAVAEDGKNGTGLKWIGWIYCAFSGVMVCLSGLLLLDAVPEALAPVVYWTGVRTSIFWHPNGCGGILMTGIGMTLYLMAREERKRGRIALGILVLLEYGALILTNSRTTIIMSAALIAGSVFFLIWKGSWKQFLAAGAAAAVILAVLLVAYNGLFELHNQFQVSKLVEQAQQEMQPIPETEAVSETEAVPETEAASETKAATKKKAASKKKTVTETEAAETEEEKQELHIDEETGKATVTGITGSNQGDLIKDMKSLNGRTKIWKAAFQVLQDIPSVKLWGTVYAAAEISYRNSFAVVNAHNSWIEMLVLLGVPGLLLSLVFTVLGVWNILRLLWRQNVDLSKKIVALLMICLFGAGCLESYLFFGEMSTTFANFLFFLCLGYMIRWNRIADGRE